MQQSSDFCIAYSTVQFDLVSLARLDLQKAGLAESVQKATHMPSVSIPREIMSVTFAGKGLLE